MGSSWLLTYHVFVPHDGLYSGSFIRLQKSFQYLTQNCVNVIQELKVNINSLLN